MVGFWSEFSSRLQMDSFLLYPHMRERERKEAVMALRRALTLSMRVLSSWPPLNFTMFKIIILGQRVSTYEFWVEYTNIQSSDHFSFINWAISENSILILRSRIAVC